ncbi:MAG: DNA-directed RNA polymerase subunit omega [Vicinamibacterales bacterium]
MYAPPPGVGVLQFVVLASLRAAQLMRGCRPKLDGFHKPVFMALREVSEGKISEWTAPDPALETVVPEPEAAVQS